MSKFQEIEVKVTKPLFFLMLFVAVMSLIGVAAPYIHMLLPRTASEILTLEESFTNGLINNETYTSQLHLLKEKYEFLGFIDVRHFMFAIGLPIALLVCSSFFLLSTFIKKDALLKVFRVISMLFMFTGCYFIAWTVWDQKDFPKSAYYTTLTLLSIFTSITLYYLFKTIVFDINRVERIKHQMKPLRKNVEFVTDLSEIMPDDDVNITYKAMTSVVGEDLKDNVKSIEFTLND